MSNASRRYKNGGMMGAYALRTFLKKFTRSSEYAVAAKSNESTSSPTTRKRPQLALLSVIMAVLLDTFSQDKTKPFASNWYSMHLIIHFWQQRVRIIQDRKSPLTNSYAQ
jgi:hypothetical protein